MSRPDALDFIEAAADGITEAEIEARLAEVLAAAGGHAQPCDPSEDGCLKCGATGPQGCPYKTGNVSGITEAEMEARLAEMLAAAQSHDERKAGPWEATRAAPTA